MAKASSYYSYPPSPHYSSYSPPKQPFPPELLLGLALFATLVLYALGLSWSGVIFHPIYSLRSVAELVQYKLARISDGFADMDWEKVALGIRGEPADDNDDLGVEARERIVRSYRELNQSKPEAGASLGASALSPSAMTLAHLDPVRQENTTRASSTPLGTSAS